MRPLTDNQDLLSAGEWERAASIAISATPGRSEVKNGGLRGPCVHTPPSVCRLSLAPGWSIPSVQAVRGVCEDERAVNWRGAPRGP